MTIKRVHTIGTSINNYSRLIPSVYLRDFPLNQITNIKYIPALIKRCGANIRYSIT